MSTTVLAIDHAMSGSMEYASLLGAIGVILFVLTIIATATPINVMYDDISKIMTHTQKVLFGARSELTAAP